MKKFLITLMIVAAATSLATAGVGITWEVGWGGYTHNAPNITDDPSTFAILNNYSVIWQLIYAGGDGAIDPPSLANAGSGYVTDDDSVWATRTLGQTATSSTDTGPGGASFNGFLARVGTSGSTDYIDASWATAGSVYQRVFEGTPAPGTYWYDSPLFVFNEKFDPSAEPKPTPQGFNPEVNPGNGGFQAPGQNKFPAVVPEPATMGLLGLGALVMAIRRRRS
jgi:hypothetical protein